MQTTIHTNEPPSYTENEPERRVVYDIGFALIVLLFVLILIYTSYMCNRIKHPPSPPLPTTVHSDSDSDDFGSVILSTNHEDDILSAFPTFVYSEAVSCDSGCTICLADYEPNDVLRSLPECGHLFHVGCVDTWLKVHPACPVCRKSPLPAALELG